jgi:serine phosphatase RsbU (regulator of sigma subunit)
VVSDTTNRPAEVRTAAVLAPPRAERSGGDFHWIDRTGAPTVAVVGDVTGKGEPAAPYAEQVRAWLGESAREVDEDPAALLEHLNSLIDAADEFPPVAAAALVIQAERWSATWAYAGHLPPVHLDTGLPLDGATPGTLLGLQPACGAGNAHRRPVRPGEGFALYTDGLEDAVGAGGGRFGTAESPTRSRTA